MKRSEYLIRKLESFPNDVSLPEVERKRLHDRYSDLYWNAVGVPPDFRDQLKAALDDIVEHGDRWVEDLMSEFRYRIYSSPLRSSFESGNETSVVSEPEVGEMQIRGD